MASGQDPHDSDGAGNPVPFLVSHPCPACAGEGSGCARCQGTGVGRFFHGTKVNLDVGGLIECGHGANYGELYRVTTYVYFTGSLYAATWGAELARGSGRGRIYVVEPTGAFENDPNLTDKKFPGNPTKSYRSREPLRVVGEVTNRRGPSPEALAAMKAGQETLKKQGVQPIE